MRPDAIGPWNPSIWSQTPAEWAESSDYLELPRVSVAILSYNRMRDLAITLDAVQHGTDYPNLEIVVVDNGSSDGSQDFVRQRFPAVRLQCNEHNIGIAARNQFPAICSGEFIYSLDDDSMPATPSTILRLVHFMRANPRYTAVSPYCYQTHSGICETAEWARFRTTHVAAGYEGIFIVEGGSFWRADALRRLEGYTPDFFWGTEGTDLALDGIKHGHVFLLSPNFATLHMKSEVNRSLERNLFYNTRNTFLLFKKHFGRPSFYVLSMLWMLRKLLSILRWPRLTPAILRGLAAGLRDVRHFERGSKLTFNQMRNLGRAYLHIFRW